MSARAKEWLGPSPPTTLPINAGFTFEVNGDNAALNRVLTNPFVFDPHVYALPIGGYSVSSGAGANPKETLLKLEELAQGAIVNLGTDPVWRIYPEGGAAVAEDTVHISGSFGATLLDPYQKVPVPGAYILYGPLTPTPSFNPGERLGDDQSPRIVRSDGKGAYSALLDGLSGSIEIRVAKGGEERKSFAIADAPTRPSSTSTVPQTAQRAAEARTSSSSSGLNYRDEWGMERIGWTPGIGALAKSPVVVAVIDTGLDYYHPALPRENVFVNRKESLDGRDDDSNGYVGDVVGWNFVDNNGNPWDTAGHGTMVAGIIAEIDPQVGILPLKALNFIGQGRASRVAEAIYYAVGMGASIINLSLGGEERSQAAERAMAYAGSKGILIVIAAGNGGTRITRAGPPSLPNVITVGATGVDDKRASFSNYGAVDLAAPGVEILSLRARRTDVALVAGVEGYVAGRNFVGEKARYYRANGTSFATPFVSGAAALILSLHPELDAASVKRMIVQSARDPGTVGVNPETGYGVLDVKAALAADPHYFVEVDIADVSVQKTDSGVFVRVKGTADADRFGSAWIEVGRGESPTEWQRIPQAFDKPVRGGTLEDLPAQQFAGAPVWTLRLIVKHANGSTRETRHVLRVS